MSNSHGVGVYGAIILAAGASTRMGHVKQLLPWKGSTLLQHAIDEVLSSEIDETVVVLGANKRLIEEQTNLSGVDSVFNAKWEEGMASSIVTGLKHLLSKAPEIGAVLIVLCDQPLLDKNNYNRLIKKIITNKNKIISSSYSDQLGVPVVFDKRFFSDLLKLRGEQGAKKLLATYNSEVIGVEAGDKAIDLDTEDKYNHYYDLYGRP